MLDTAKKCNTKQSWSELFAANRDLITNCNDTNLIKRLFFRLRADENSLHYDPGIWTILLRSCLSNWDLQLGKEISAFTEPIANATTSLLAAEIYLEAGQPAKARKSARRALRLKEISSSESIQCHMILCRSYVEQGRKVMAIRLLNKIETEIESKIYTDNFRSDIYTSIGRTFFFLGSYLEAARYFERSAPLLEAQGSWETLARVLFNAAASYHNSSKQHHEHAFNLVKRCHSISTTHTLRGPLSHCLAFYGTHHYQIGSFGLAANYYRRALDALPSVEDSFRRLHILSMLTFSLLRKGQLKQGFNYGKKTLALARKDQSSRFKIRYLALEAEILWHQNKLEDADTKLSEALKEVVTGGIHTLEQLSSYSRYLWQRAQVSNIKDLINPKINSVLKQNLPAWAEYCLAKAEVALTEDKVTDAIRLAQDVQQMAQAMNSFHFKIRSIHLLAQCRLRLQRPLNHIEPLLKELADLVRKDSDHTHDHFLLILQAAVAYRKLRFNDCVRLLSQAEKHSSCSHSDRNIIQSWLATALGQPIKSRNQTLRKLLQRQTNIYFGNSLEKISQNSYRINQIYTISLAKQPILIKLLDHLMKHGKANLSEIQAAVWQQSERQVGWEQKIRNTLGRLRRAFPLTMLPIVRCQNQIVTLEETFYSLSRQQSESLSSSASISEQLINLLQTNDFLRSIEIAERLSISSATTKRILNQLKQERIIYESKRGRFRYYRYNAHPDTKLDLSSNSYGLS